MLGLKLNHVSKRAPEHQITADQNSTTSPASKRLYIKRMTIVKLKMGFCQDIFLTLYVLNWIWGNTNIFLCTAMAHIVEFLLHGKQSSIHFHSQYHGANVLASRYHGANVLAKLYRQYHGANVLAKLHSQYHGANVLAKLHSQYHGANVLAKQGTWAPATRVWI